MKKLMMFLTAVLVVLNNMSAVAAPTNLGKAKSNVFVLVTPSKVIMQKTAQAVSTLVVSGSPSSKKFTSMESLVQPGFELAVANNMNSATLLIPGSHSFKKFTSMESLAPPGYVIVVPSSNPANTLESILSPTTPLREDPGRIGVLTHSSSC